ncbi:hypothetical protein [Mycolicibacterium hippocampi]|uniref:Lipoprotein n=1 Tax=Mycolicibacterium hippocampi TaxID=659824 RepID=A0A7I9ZN65_9MYCO|nr:hypothetical protein [Mycolicibacterium hippocampi]GFH02444.1 hypothetical protein MHIP_29270 [Mycolicibacterium hippocampi]
MTFAATARPALITVSGALAAGWFLVACGDDGSADTENTTVETTETTQTTEPADTTEPTIEVPSPDVEAPDVEAPDVDIPSPEVPEVTPSPVP